MGKTKQEWLDEFQIKHSREPTDAELLSAAENLEFSFFDKTKSTEETEPKGNEIQQFNANSIKNKMNFGKSGKRLVGFGIAGVVLLILVIGALVWHSGSAYRTEMQVANSYFKNGNYPDATKAYKKAHEMKPKESKALTMSSYSDELGKVWWQINNDDFSFDGQYSDSELRNTYEGLKSKRKEIKDKIVIKAYDEAIHRINDQAGYE